MIERRRLALYSGAFVMMLVAGVVLVVAGRGFLTSFRLLWISISFSVAAILTAAVAVLLPRR
ncbi:MAG: hypothetical protein M3O88_07555 [Actinomycetota bacterium]|nr:hypothetical protein [Actinomycetota bacterium]